MLDVCFITYPQPRSGCRHNRQRERERERKLAMASVSSPARRLNFPRRAPAADLLGASPAVPLQGLLQSPIPGQSAGSAGAGFGSPDQRQMQLPPLPASPFSPTGAAAFASGGSGTPTTQQRDLGSATAAGGSPTAAGAAGTAAGAAGSPAAGSTTQTTMRGGPSSIT
jgi:hypothetical protein